MINKKDHDYNRYMNFVEHVVIENLDSETCYRVNLRGTSGALDDISVIPR